MSFRASVLTKNHGQLNLIKIVPAIVMRLVYLGNSGLLMGLLLVLDFLLVMSYISYIRLAFCLVGLILESSSIGPIL